MKLHQMISRAMSALLLALLLGQPATAFASTDINAQGLAIIAANPKNLPANTTPLATDAIVCQPTAGGSAKKCTVAQVAFSADPNWSVPSAGVISGTDSASIQIGSGNFSSVTPNLSGIYVERALSSPGDGHGVTVADVFTGSNGYASYAAFNDYSSITDSYVHNHHHSFQGAFLYAGTGTLTNMDDYMSGGSITSGTVTQAAHFLASTTQVSGTGTLGTQYGLYISDLTGATTNWGIYQHSVTNANWFAGDIITQSSIWGNLGVVAGNAHLNFPQGTAYSRMSGSQLLNWSGVTFANFVVGDPSTAGSSLFVNTPSFSSSFDSGLGVSGAYSSLVSTVNIGAYGVHSGGGFVSKLCFNTTLNTGLVPVQCMDWNAHIISQGSAPSCGTGCASVAGNDTRFTATTGTTVTSVAVSFAATWGAAPKCVATTNTTSAFAAITAISTTQITFGLSSALSGGLIYVSCGQ